MLDLLCLATLEAGDKEQASGTLRSIQAALAPQVTVDWDVPGEAGELAHQASELREKAECIAAEASEKAEIAVMELRGRKFSSHHTTSRPSFMARSSF